MRRKRRGVIFKENREREERKEVKKSGFGSSRSSFWPRALLRAVSVTTGQLENLPTPESPPF